jgi:arginyl-tRNA synthetase
MKPLLDDLTRRFADAIAAVYPDLAADAPASVVPAKDPRFGDYQFNHAMALAKKVRAKPREVAEAIRAAVDLAGVCESATVEGPGFINLRLAADHLAARLAAMENERLGVPEPARRLRVVVDFSSPNIAKEMHVGHLRSTILGDAISRVLAFVGHDVLRLNHLGDWGTQFGMLITHLTEVFPDALTRPEGVRIADLDGFYKEAKKRFDADAAFADRAREQVVKLQGGDAAARRAWEVLCDASRAEFRKIYDRLGVAIQERGESFYNPRLPAVVADLAARGLLQESDGAQVVFVPGFVGREGEPQPLIVRKRDGGYNYATTDLAAVRHRVAEERAGWIAYVTDAGQAQHFAQVFAVARTAGWLTDAVRVDHVGFGLVQREIVDAAGKVVGKEKFKTREGEVVKLTTLLDEAVRRAEVVAREKNPDLSEADAARIASVLGLGAVKYADLSQNRTSDYVFSFDKMLDLKGNTAPYMIYAVVRVRSIGRKGEVDYDALDRGGPIALGAPEERDLALTLARFPDAVLETAESLYPHVLTGYLYDLAGAYSRFFTACPVLQSEGPTRTHRLRLCALTARVLETGLGLLGIGVLERM